MIMCLWEVIYLIMWNDYVWEVINHIIHMKWLRMRSNYLIMKWLMRSNYLIIWNDYVWEVIT